MIERREMGECDYTKRYNARHGGDLFKVGTVKTGGRKRKSADTAEEPSKKQRSDLDDAKESEDQMPAFQDQVDGEGSGDEDGKTSNQGSGVHRTRIAGMDRLMRQFAASKAKLPGDTSALARRFRWASHGTVLRQETDHERKKRLAEAKRRDKVSLTCLELTELRSSTACPGREQAARPAFRRLDGQRGRHLSIASWRRLGGATASTGRSRRLRGHVRTQEVNGASIPGHW
jgi:hypothetical protein